MVRESGIQRETGLLTGAGYDAEKRANITRSGAGHSVQGYIQCFACVLFSQFMARVQPDRVHTGSFRAMVVTLVTKLLKAVI